jgi:hypothetical protein
VSSYKPAWYHDDAAARWWIGSAHARGLSREFAERIVRAVCAREARAAGWSEEEAQVRLKARLDYLEEVFGPSEEEGS